MADYQEPDQRPIDDERGRERIVRCRAVEEHLRLLRRDPEYRWRRREIEREVAAWTARYQRSGVRTGIIRIPVVVHVVHNTAAQNISDAQINSQITSLNQDFRRLNADASSTPSAFASVAADARIEFALAVRDPSCAPTTGIDRVSTTTTGWSYPGEGMKSAATGGADQWDPNEYLNIWVVNYTDGTLGYGTFPGMAANIQGVVVDFEAFGTTGTLTSGAHLGRTLTHEVGHYLDLFHIWGDDQLDPDTCGGSDLVADTPNQSVSSPFSGSTCRTFPAVSCSNGPNGDMFMNYLDYSGDQCMNLFTAGQVVRMDAALHTARTSLLSSHGLVPPAGVLGPDLWAADTSDDTGIEPNPTTEPLYLSNDIWVRTGSDGLVNHDHQNAEYRPPGAASNNVYVRVRNRACTGSQSGTLRLYWAKASSGLSWPSPWDGSVTTPALMGGAIGSQPVTVAAQGDTIVSFAWSPPNPADYVSFGADQHHFCLLARIETSSTSPFGMTSTETTNLGANVRNNNNIVWKNISVVDEVADGGRKTGLTVANFGRKPQEARLVFMAPKERLTVFEWGRVIVEVPGERAEQLREAGGDGVEWIGATTFEVVGSGATVGPLELAAGDLFALNVWFVAHGKEPFGARILPFDVFQFDGDELVGGVRFNVRTHAVLQTPVDTAPGPLDGHNWVTGTGIDELSCGCRCTCRC